MCLHFQSRSWKSHWRRKITNFDSQFRESYVLIVRPSIRTTLTSPPSMMRIFLSNANRNGTKMNSLSTDQWSVPSFSIMGAGMSLWMQPLSPWSGSIAGCTQNATAPSISVRFVSRLDPGHTGRPKVINSHKQGPLAAAQLSLLLLSNIIRLGAPHCCSIL